MPLFSYRAVDPDGSTISGNMLASDIVEMKRKLVDEGLTPVKIGRSSALAEKLTAQLTKKVKIKSIAIFCRQLSIIVKSGVNVIRGLEILKDQTKDKDLKKVILILYSEVQKGLSLYEALLSIESALPVFFVQMIAVGEKSGNLDEVLTRLADYFDKESIINSKIKGAMIYPVILSLVGLAMLAFFINFVLPEIVSMITDVGGEVPLITSVVIGSIDLLTNNLVFIVIGVVLLLGLFKYSLTKSSVRLGFHKLLLRVPIVCNTIRNAVTAKFLRTSFLMLKSGIPIIFILERTEKIVGNAVAEVAIHNALEQIKKGETLGENLSYGDFFEPMVLHMISIAEEAGELDNVLEMLADHYDKESELWIAKLMAAIEPAFTVIIGLVLGVLIIAMMIPIFGLANQIGQ